ncbi:MAG: hypothetical protein WC728_12860 [Elusimicrobiota bacterium]
MNTHWGRMILGLILTAPHTLLPLVPREPVPAVGEARPVPAGLAETFLSEGVRELEVGEGQGRALVKELPAEGDWLSPFTGTDAAYESFSRSVRERVDPEPYALLRRQRAIYERAGFSEELPKFDDVIEGRLGRIRPINRLEAAVLMLHQQRFGRESEFEAFILRNAQGRLRVYYNGGPELSPPSAPAVRKRVEADAAAGWRLAFHLHNHPFLFSNPAEDFAGTTIPSGGASFGDVSTYLRDAKNLGLGGALITNGFHTLELGPSDFDRLASSWKKDLALLGQSQVFW